MDFSDKMGFSEDRQRGKGVKFETYDNDDCNDYNPKEAYDGYKKVMHKSVKRISKFITIEDEKNEDEITQLNLDVKQLVDNARSRASKQKEDTRNFNIEINYMERNQIQNNNIDKASINYSSNLSYHDMFSKKETGNTSHLIKKYSAEKREVIANTGSYKMSTLDPDVVYDENLYKKHDTNVNDNTLTKHEKVKFTNMGINNN